MDYRSLLRRAILFLLIWQALAYAAPPAPVAPKVPLLSLDDAVLLALRYNPSIQNAKIQRIIDKFNLKLAKYSFELQYALTGGASYNNAIANGSSSEGDTASITPQIKYLTPIGTQITVSEANTFNHTAGQSRYFNPQASLSITQPLLQGFGRDVTMAPLYDAYDHELIARLGLKGIATDTITEVIRRYTAVVQAENTLKSLELSLATSLQTVNQYKIKLKVGQVAPADIIQFETDVSSRQQVIEDQKIIIKQTRIALLEALGLDPQTPFVVSKQVQMAADRLPALARGIELALQNDIAYQTSKINYKISQRQLTVDRDKQRWKLDATVTQTGGGGKGGSPNAGFDSVVNGQNKGLSAGLALAVPINDVPDKALVVKDEVSLKQAETSLAAQKRQVIDAASNAYYTLTSRKRQITQAQTTLALSQKNLSNAYLRLNAGRATPFEVSSLQALLTQAQVNLINSEISYINALADFEKTIGITLDRWNVQIRY